MAEGAYPKLTDEKYKVDKRVIKIAPATRLEGHAQINVFLDNKGEVEDTYFQVVELGHWHAHVDLESSLFICS